MAIEKHWERQGPVAFSADGTEAGLVTVFSVECFKVKQRVKIEALGEANLSLQIKRIPTPTTIIVGPIITSKPGSSINNLKARADISLYTVTKSASITASEQPKMMIDAKDIIQGVYEFEPTVAIRSFLVNKVGHGYDERNPLITKKGRSQRDSFGRDKISEQTIIFSSHFSNDPHDFEWSQRLTGAGSIVFNKTEASQLLTVGTGATDEATIQTRRHFQYLPGETLSFMFTGILPPSKTNVEAQIGAFDDEDGLFFLKNEEGMHVGLRDSTSGSVVDTIILQKDWNLDKLDGSGFSHIKLDFDKGQIFFIDFEWLGYGLIRYGFFVNGEIIYCHCISNINALDKPYNQTASLPSRFSIKNTGVTLSSTVLRQNSTSIGAEGKAKLGAITISVDNGTTAISISTVLLPILAVRLNPIFNKAELDPRTTVVFVPDKSDIRFALLYNPTLTGGTWVTVPNTIVQVNVTATAVSGGKQISSGYTAGESISSIEAGSTNFRLGSDINGIPDILVLVAQKTAVGPNANVLGTIVFREIF